MQNNFASDTAHIGRYIRKYELLFSFIISHFLKNNLRILKFLLQFLFIFNFKMKPTVHFKGENFVYEHEQVDFCKTKITACVVLPIRAVSLFRNMFSVGNRSYRMFVLKDINKIQIHYKLWANFLLNKFQYVCDKNKLV